MANREIDYQQSPPYHKNHMLSWNSQWLTQCHSYWCVLQYQIPDATPKIQRDQTSYTLGSREGIIERLRPTYIIIMPNKGFRAKRYKHVINGLVFGYFFRTFSHECCVWLKLRIYLGIWHVMSHMTHSSSKRKRYFTEYLHLWNPSYIMITH